MLLQIKGLSFSYINNNEKVDVLNNISFSEDVNKIVAIIGKSGVGKTTLLKAIAGLLKPQIGEILLNNEMIKEPSNKIGLVFQNYNVFPWLNVSKNIEFGLKYGRANVTKSDFAVEVDDILTSLGLNNDKQKWPSQLSGGMLQRVAIGRTLAAKPQLLLLDEPFSSIDFLNRFELQKILKSIASSQQRSIIIITHNIDEAVKLADRIILLGGNPTTIIKDWSINKDQKANSLFELTLEQKKIIAEIIETLK